MVSTPTPKPEARISVDERVFRCPRGTRPGEGSAPAFRGRILAMRKRQADFKGVVSEGFTPRYKNLQLQAMISSLGGGIARKLGTGAALGPGSGRL
jgi:hypothetical protein